MINAYSSVGKPERKRLLGVDRIRDGIKMGVRLWTGFIWLTIRDSDSFL
jgi:hypothetical protein